MRVKCRFDFVTRECSFDCECLSDGELTLAGDFDGCRPADVFDAYKMHGMFCPEHLSGNFAFCLYDRSAGKLLAARDRLGLKRLYFTQLPTSVVFASELSACLEELPHPVVDKLQLAQSVRINYATDLRRTWIEQVSRLDSGECAHISAEGIAISRWWTRTHKPSFAGSRSDALAQALDLARRSVRKSLESAGGPVAVLLSGGMDSSMLAALASETLPEVHVFSAGYAGNVYKACDERVTARRFAAERGFIYHEVELGKDDFISILDELTPFLDESCYDVSCISQYALYREASRMGFKLILSGLGGDELFYSYAYNNAIVRSLSLRREFNSLYPVKKHAFRYISFVLKNLKYLLLPNHPVLVDESVPVTWTYGDYVEFSSDAALKVPGGEFRFADVDTSFTFHLSTELDGMYDFIFSRFLVNMCVYMSGKLCEAGGTRICFPLLDSAFVDFMDSLPEDFKFDPRSPKQFQRDMMKGLLPDYILNARKRGFEPPFEFIRAICSDYEYRHIAASRCFFNSMMADRLIDNHLFKR